MKGLKLLTVILLVFMASCKLEAPYTYVTGATLFIKERIVPESGVVDQPVYISALGAAYNDCWSKVTVNLYLGGNEFEYRLVAKGNYKSYGTCSELLITTDSIVSFTPKKAGKYIITTWVDPATTENDTIVVTAP